MIKKKVAFETRDQFFNVLYLSLGLEIVDLDRDDVMIIAEIAGGGREAKVVAGGQADVVDAEALLPLVLVVDVRGHGELVVLVAHGHERFVVLVAEGRLAAGQLRVRAVLVVVIVQAAVVHHRRYVRMPVLFNIES